MRNNILYFLTLLFTGITLFQSCESEENINYQRYYVNGKGLYETHCQNCHGAKGEGLGKLYPPLTDTLFLSRNKSRLACIIKNGWKQKISIHNVIYESEMPGNETLADIDVAQVIVYITNSFGNKQGFYDASPATSDLKSCN